MTNNDNTISIEGYITEINIEKIYEQGFNGLMDIRATVTFFDSSSLTKTIVKFYFVRDLIIENQDMSGGSRLEILSIEDRQWENCNYEVCDEEGCIHFYCKYFHILKNNE